MLTALGVLLLVLVTAGTGYFVAQEFAYLGADRGRLSRLAAEGNPAAARAVELTGRLSFVLSGAQLGITVTALLAGYLAEPFLGGGLRDGLAALGLPAALAGPAAGLLALVLATAVQMVLGELAPKNLGIARPDRLAVALSGSTRAYLRVVSPLVRLLDGAANRLLRRLGIEPAEELPIGVTADDLGGIVTDSAAQGRLAPDLAAALGRALAFGDRTAGQVMVARVDVHTLPADAPATAVLDALDTGNARFPVLRDGVDDLVGVVGLAEVLAVPAHRRAGVPVGALAAAPLLVPASLPLPRVLEALRAQRRQLACVIDEYGGFAGIVTLEDVVEELVGDIRDEDDTELPQPRRTATGWLVPARLRPDELAAATGIELPADGRYDTLGGCLLAALGRLPRVADRVRVDTVDGGRVELTVTRLARRVPAELNVTRLAEAADPATNDQPANGAAAAGAVLGDSAAIGASASSTAGRPVGAGTVANSAAGAGASAGPAAADAAPEGATPSGSRTASATSDGSVLPEQVSA
ncbi:membrane protein [Actinocatenispora thailandica]|uniref:Membrane protein n=1 Tax=Actinocatenispora thailandica TaxID=227318 RepID=A0A7R7DK39_9ACTN|nr:hemolysin family protein [Actinocatenispora thailandica]BCJ32941.1 membrane protein [Actinocatenispora thailandica]